MVYFPNVNIELWDYAESATDFNSYYEPEKTYTKTTTTPANFQPMSPSETLKEFGEILTDTYMIIINSNVEINHSMLIRIENEESTYEIIGTPMTNNRFAPTKHTKIIVQKERKPTPLQEED